MPGERSSPEATRKTTSTAMVFPFLGKRRATLDLSQQEAVRNLLQRYISATHVGLRNKPEILYRA